MPSRDVFETKCDSSIPKCGQVIWSEFGVKLFEYVNATFEPHMVFGRSDFGNAACLSDLPGGKRQLVIRYVLRELVARGLLVKVSSVRYAFPEKGGEDMVPRFLNMQRYRNTWLRHGGAIKREIDRLPARTPFSRPQLLERFDWATQMTTGTRTVLLSMMWAEILGRRWLVSCPNERHQHFYCRLEATTPSK